MKMEELKGEPSLTQMLLNKASHQLIPMSGTFELTPMCNFSCNMCYIRKNAEEIAAHPCKMLTLKDWIHIAEEAKEAGMLYLLITGGEPLLWSDFWTLYERLSEMGFLISINTNGSLIDEQVVERFKQYPPVRVNISLYGVEEDSYEKLCGVKNVFSRVDYAITKLVEAGIEVKLNGTLTPDNVKDLESCIAYANEKDLIYEVNTYMFPPLRRDESMIGKNERFTPAEAAYYRAKSYRLQYGSERYHKYMQAINEGSISPPGLDEKCVDPKDGKICCRAGKASFWITWDGFMTPCGMMPNPAVDLKDKNFSLAWKELTYQGRRLSLSGICNRCSNRSVCHMCAAMAMAETGKTEGIPSYLCHMIEEIRWLAKMEMAGEPFPSKPRIGNI